MSYFTMTKSTRKLMREFLLSHVISTCVCSMTITSFRLPVHMRRLPKTTFQWLSGKHRCRSTTTPMCFRGVFMIIVLISVLTSVRERRRLCCTSMTGTIFSSAHLINGTTAPLTAAVSWNRRSTRRKFCDKRLIHHNYSSISRNLTIHSDHRCPSREVQEST